MKAPPARSTLADALNSRDWRIYHALAQRLIANGMGSRGRSVLQCLRTVLNEEHEHHTFCVRDLDLPVEMPEGGIKCDAFLKLNPMGKMPCLVDGDFALPESAVIID